MPRGSGRLELTWRPYRRRSDALAKGNAFLAEGQKGLARDCFVKGVDVTPEMAYQLIKVCFPVLPDSQHLLM